MGASYQLVEQADGLPGHEVLNPEPGAAAILQRLCVEHCAYRDLVGDLGELLLPAGVTLDDVLDAVVGLSVGHAILDSKNSQPTPEARSNS